jgi:hypothetical protein
MLRFLYSYIWKGGFLDGTAGYVFCRLLAIYEYLSVAKFHELKRAEDDQRKARQLSAVPAVKLQSTNPSDARNVHTALHGSSVKELATLSSDKP